MNTDTLYDVIIVGAGPSGSICAKKLASNGFKVLLTEQFNLPRNKCCTGIIAPDAVDIIEKELGNFPRALCVRPEKFKGFKYKMAKGVPFITMKQADDEICYSVWRRDFDFWLTLSASMAGADVLDECTYTGIDKLDEHEITVKFLVKSEDAVSKSIKTFRSRYLIGADGIGSKLRKDLFNTPEKFYYCRQEYYTGTSDLEVGYYYYFRYNSAVEDPIWVFYKDGYIVIGSVAYPGKIMDENRKKIHKYLKDNFSLEVKERKFFEVCRESTNFTIQKLSKGDLEFTYGVDNYPVLFVGEAAQMVDSMGEGIAVALESGCHAAESIIAYEKNHDRPLQDIYKEKCGSLAEKITGKWTAFYKKFGSFF